MGDARLGATHGLQAPICRRAFTVQVEVACAAGRCAAGVRWLQQHGNCEIGEH